MDMEVDNDQELGRPKKKWIDNIKEDCTDMGIPINEAMKLPEIGTMEQHCPQPGLPAREDFVIVTEALSQVSQELIRRRTDM